MGTQVETATGQVIAKRTCKQHVGACIEVFVPFDQMASWEGVAVWAEDEDRASNPWGTPFSVWVAAQAPRHPVVVFAKTRAS